jgi:hypothetical protein
MFFDNATTDQSRRCMDEPWVPACQPSLQVGRCTEVWLPPACEGARRYGCQKQRSAGYQVHANRELFWLEKKQVRMISRPYQKVEMCAFGDPKKGEGAAVSVGPCLGLEHGEMRAALGTEFDFDFQHERLAHGKPQAVAFRVGTSCWTATAASGILLQPCKEADRNQRFWVGHAGDSRTVDMPDPSPFLPDHGRAWQCCGATAVADQAGNMPPDCCSKRAPLTNAEYFQQHSS